MAFFNYATMQMAAKVVYYGPGLCGKTTNLQYIYNKTTPKSRGEMVSLETESDRTLFFDLLPIEVGVIGGFKTRFQLYTVPGQVFYGETRRMVLKGVDGVVFVADSQSPMKEANIESMKDLEKNLDELKIDLKAIPMVLQFNKRDLKNILSVEELHKDLNWHGWDAFESSAINGKGVFDTLKGISRLTLRSLRQKLEQQPEQAVRVASVVPRKLGPLEQKRIEPDVRKPEGKAPVPEVQFAELKTLLPDQELAKRAPKIKTVSTSQAKVSQELDRIRESLLGPILNVPPRPKVKDLMPAIEDLRKVAQAPPSSPLPPEVEVEVPEKYLRDLMSLQIDVSFVDPSRKRRLPGTLKIPVEKMSSTGEVQHLRLCFKPKKS